MTVTTTKVGTFVDTGVAVPNLKDATAFWTTAMGFEHVADSQGFPNWCMVRDPETDQRLMLVEDHNLPLALSFESPNVDESVSFLEEAGCTVDDRGTAGSWEWAVVRTPSNATLMLGSDNESPHGQRGSVTTVAGRIGKFADTMVAVPDVAQAVTFWTDTMGFTKTGEGMGDNFVILEAATTGQRLCLYTDSDLPEWSVSIVTPADNFEAALTRFREAGGEVLRQGREDNGFLWSICRDPNNLPVVIST